MRPLRDGRSSRLRVVWGGPRRRAGRLPALRRVARGAAGLRALTGSRAGRAPCPTRSQARTGRASRTRSSASRASAAPDATPTPTSSTCAGAAVSTIAHSGLSSRSTPATGAPAGARAPCARRAPSSTLPGADHTRTSQRDAGAATSARPAIGCAAPTHHAAPRAADDAERGQAVASTRTPAEGRSSPAPQPTSPPPGPAAAAHASTTARTHARPGRQDLAARPDRARRGDHRGRWPSGPRRLPSRRGHGRG